MAVYEHIPSDTHQLATEHNLGHDNNLLTAFDDGLGELAAIDEELLLLKAFSKAVATESAHRSLADVYLASPGGSLGVRLKSASDSLRERNPNVYLEGLGVTDILTASLDIKKQEIAHQWRKTQLDRFGGQVVLLQGVQAEPKSARTQAIRPRLAAPRAVSSPNLVEEWLRSPQDAVFGQIHDLGLGDGSFGELGPHMDIQTEDLGKYPGWPGPGFTRVTRLFAASSHPDLDGRINMVDVHLQRPRELTKG